MPDRTCIVPDCPKTPRSALADYCAMHYHRMYRHGSVDRNANTAGISVSHGRRYRRVVAKGHPLADKYDRAYEHRVVLFDTIGTGPHVCHWCKTSIDWAPKGTPHALHVDHLNAIGDDNRPENLVPSCAACNTARGAQARADALRAAGWWSQHDTIEALANQRRRTRVA